MSAQQLELSREVFLTRLARALHVYGTPAHTLEASLAECADSLGVQAQLFSTPTAIFASFGPLEDHRTVLIRVEPGEIDLGKLLEVDELRGGVVRGELGVEDATAALDRLLRTPPRYRESVVAIAFVVATASASRFFGGGWREIAAATLVGLVAFLVGLVTGRRPTTATLFQPLAAFLVAFLAFVALGLVSLDANLVVLSGLIVLIPGLSLTIALNELAARHLSSGTSRLMGASIQFLTIGFGVALGRKTAGFIVPIDPTSIAGAEALPGWTLAVSLLIAPLAFAVLFQAPAREMPAIVVASVCGFAGARFGAEAFGPQLGAFLGALLVGLVSNGYSRWRDRSPAVLLVPGLLMPVPGSLGLRSFSALLDDEVVRGIDAAFEMALVAVALVAGLLVANVAVRPHRWRRVVQVGRASVASPAEAVDTADPG